ncbi:MAG: hypothetical protein V3S10_04555 [Dehalococcoidales bacterium]
MTTFRRALPAAAGIALIALLAALVPAQPSLAAPVAEASPASGGRGTNVTISGFNFDSFEGDRVYLFFNGVAIISSPVVVSGGGFETSFSVPDSTLPGVAAVTVLSDIGSLLAEVHFTVLPPAIALDISSGVVGTVVTLSCQGFYADRIVVFTYDHGGVRDKQGETVAGPTGDCTFDLAIPSGKAGRHTVIAQNAQGDVASVYFEVLPSVVIDPLRGPGGLIVAITGTGFGVDQEITVDFRSTRISYAATDHYGDFEGDFRVPVLAAGVHPLTIEDATGNQAEGRFTIVPGAALTPPDGSVGQEAVITATGFAPDQIVTVRYDGIEVARTKADDVGSLAAAFDVPPSTRGAHTVTITDGVETQQAIFTMENVPPAVPEPGLPEADAEVLPPITFTWAAVDDPSLPVKYTLQVAGDDSFTELAFEKTGLAESAYTLTREERLRPSSRSGGYFWRVMAVDAASNQSPWSTPQPFLAGKGQLMPDWAVYALIGLGVVVVGFLIFRIRKKSARYWAD